MSDDSVHSVDGTAHQQIYECTECSHRIKIYQREEQAVFCGCNPANRPPMEPTETEDFSDV